MLKGSARGPGTGTNIRILVASVSDGRIWNPSSPRLRCYPKLVKRKGSPIGPDRYIGRPLESLSLAERWRLSGKWIALEIYTPATTPIRAIQALGASPQECIEQLASRGLRPAAYELLPLSQPYET